LGKIKKLTENGDSGITFTSLQAEGYDSACVPRQNGNEYVVYNCDQVIILDDSAIHYPASCRFEFIPYSTRARTLADGYETTWEWLKKVSIENRTSGGVGAGARYFKTVSKGPELFALYNNNFYYHDKNQWHKYNSSKILYLSN